MYPHSHHKFCVDLLFFLVIVITKHIYIILYTYKFKIYKIE